MVIAAGQPRRLSPQGHLRGGRTNASVAAWALLGLQRFYQPGDDYFFEDSGVAPHAYLTAQVTAVRIDPCFFGNVAFAQQKIFVFDRHLRVEDAGDDEHGRHRLAEQALANQRHLRQILAHFVERVNAFEKIHQRGHLIEKIFAITQQRVR